MSLLIAIIIALVVFLTLWGISKIYESLNEHEYSIPVPDVSKGQKYF